MTISLAVADQRDGTGLATITGSNVASTNSLLVATFTGAAGPLVWSAAGSRTGDGTIVSSPAPGAGFYLWVVLNTLAGVTTQTNTVYRPLTNTSTAELAVHYQCLLAIQTLVNSLNLPINPAPDATVLDPANVVIQWLPRVSTKVDVAFPRIILCPMGAEAQPGTTNTRDDIKYRSALVIVDQQNQDYTANLARNLLWRQKIFRLFRHDALAGAPTVILVDVTPNLVIQPDWFAANLFGAGMTIDAISREPRGR